MNKLLKTSLHTVIQKTINFDKRFYKQFCKLLSPDTNPKKSLYTLFRLALIFTILIFLINLFFNHPTEQGLGQWGDFFGGVLNPILTFLTFMGLLITIVLQQKELKESRNEFEGQKNALISQQEEMVKQTFDNKFFQMLNQFNNIKEIVNIDDFGSLNWRLITEINDMKSLSKFEISFQKINHAYDGTIKYYCINLYQILHYVDKDIPSKLNPKKYTNIIRAQLSKDELLLLFYNCLGVREFSGNKYKTLVEKYAIFEHLRIEDFYYGYFESEKNEKIKRTIFSTNQFLFLEYGLSAFGKNIPLTEHIKQIK